MGVTQPPVKEQSYSDEWGSIVPKTGQSSWILQGITNEIFIHPRI